MRPAIGGAIATPAASAVFPGASWASASEAEPGNACRCALDAAGDYVRTLAALGIDDVGAAAIECQAGVRDLRGARRIRPVPSPVHARHGASGLPGAAPGQLARPAARAGRLGWATHASSAASSRNTPLRLSER